MRPVFRHLDFATVQGYDFHGTWESVTNQQSALRVPAGAPTTPDFSIDSTVKAWLTRGAPRDRLVVGIPYYGQGWTGVSGGGDGHVPAGDRPGAGHLGAPATRTTRCSRR